MVIELNKDNIGYAEKVNKCIIECYAPWCALCKGSEKIFTELSNEINGIYFFKINVDECEFIKKEFELKILPTFVYLENGVIKIKVEGYKDKTSILQLLTN